MKTSIKIIIAILCVTSNLIAQTDFAIPDAPAFAIVQQQPTSILRASTSKELMANIGSAILSEAVNQNPWGIEYNLEKRLELPIAISYATNLSPMRSFALGVRWDVFNQITAEKNKQFKGTIIELQKLANNLNEQAVSILKAKYQIEIGELRLNHSDELAKLTSDLADANKNFEMLRKSAKEQTEKLLWRKDILSFALASRFSSQDGTYDKLTLNDRRIQAWGIYTIEVGDMIQLNTNLTVLHQYIYGIDTTSGGVAIRGHYGSNSLKATLDASLLVANKSKPRIEFSVGCEWNAIEDYWLLGRLAYNALIQKIVPTIDIKYGI